MTRRGNATHGYLDEDDQPKRKRRVQRSIGDELIDWMIKPKTMARAMLIVLFVLVLLALWQGGKIYGL